MNDRELLELAAKAAGGRYTENIPGRFHLGYPPNWNGTKWNPLTDDGDALRLAVKLGLKVRWHNVLHQALVWLPCDISEIHENAEVHADDPLAATRRAIVRAAAEIGRSMP